VLVKCGKQYTQVPSGEWICIERLNASEHKHNVTDRPMRLRLCPGRHSAHT